MKLNFFVGSFLGIMGVALAPEILMEDDVLDKIDDLIFLILGAVAAYWYQKNPSDRSNKSMVLVVLALVTKFGAILVEMADKEAVGDDIGVFIGLVLATALVVSQYRKLKAVERG